MKRFAMIMFLASGSAMSSVISLRPFWVDLNPVFYSSDHDDRSSKDCETAKANLRHRSTDKIIFESACFAVVDEKCDSKFCYKLASHALVVR